MDGILPVDKPAGFTSFDVIAKLRGILREKRLGHAGTLDPDATGVLPVFVGCATRACDCLSDDRKRYTARMRLGVVTDTQDLSGKVLSACEPRVDRETLLAALSGFRGDILQVPPMYSAVSVNGKRLYELARAGKEVERQARPVRIERLDLLSFDGSEAVLDVGCSKGAYIRTLCHDVGQVLGCGAALAELRRTEAAGFTLDDCHSLDELQALAGTGEPFPLLPVDAAFRGFEAVRLGAWEAGLFRNGVRLRPDQFRAESDGLLRVYEGDTFLGLGRREEEMLRVVKNFASCQSNGKKV